VSLVAVVGAKGGPGATTAVLALGLGWPAPVLVADADPGGGDVAAGWLGGRTGLNRGLLGFAASTRHLDPVAGRVFGQELAAALAGQVGAVPGTGVLLLAGLAAAGQASAVGTAGWARLAAALTAGQGPGVGWVDVLVDAGRVGPMTPWPLMAAAEVVLLAVRPTVRGCHHACQAIPAVYGGLGGLGGVGLAVCGPGPYPPREVGLALGLPVRVVLPGDRRAAAVLSDGADGGRWPARTALARAARSAARDLHATLTPPVSVASVGSGGGR
jgi:hypothetical protein